MFHPNGYTMVKTYKKTTSGYRRKEFLSKKNIGCMYVPAALMNASIQLFVAIIIFGEAKLLESFSRTCSEFGKKESSKKISTIRLSNNLSTTGLMTQWYVLGLFVLEHGWAELDIFMQAYNQSRKVSFPF